MTERITVKIGRPKNERHALAERLSRIQTPRDLLIQRLVAERLASEQDEGSASIRWGQESTFNFTNLQSGGIGINLSEGQEEQPEQRTVTFNEINRNTENVRVENPDDPEQFVIVQRIKNITFRGADGVLYKYTLNPPPET